MKIFKSMIDEYKNKVCHKKVVGFLNILMEHIKLRIYIFYQKLTQSFTRS